MHYTSEHAMNMNKYNLSFGPIPRFVYGATAMKVKTGRDTEDLTISISMICLKILKLLSLRKTQYILIAIAMITAEKNPHKQPDISAIFFSSIND